MTKTRLKPSLTFIPSWQFNSSMNKVFLNVQKLSFMLISVFFLACENPTEIGYDFQGIDRAAASYTDTLSLVTSTVLSDSNVNGRSSYILTGNLNDPIFGSIKATAFFQPTLLKASFGDSSVPFTFLPNAIADSVRFRMINTGLITGDTLSKATFGIHRLKTAMNYSKNYNGEEGIDFEATPLTKFTINSATFKNKTFDTTLAYYVTLPISVAKEMLNLTAAERKTNSAFVNAFKGFAIVPENNAKAVYGFNTGEFASTTSTFSVYYHNANETNVLVYNFDLNGPRHSQILANRTGTPLAKLTKNANELNSTASNGKTYIQSSTGIGTKIDFGNINKLGTNIRISRATIEFIIDKTSISKQIPKIFFYIVGELDIKNQQVRDSNKRLSYLTPIGTDLSGNLGTYIDSTNTLTIDVTNYLQKITNKRQTPGSLLLMPANLTSDGNGILQNDQIRRTVFLKPKLKIFYTKF